MRTIGAAFLLVIGLVACSEDTREGTGRGKVYSCNSERMLRCTEDRNSALKVESLEKLCTSNGDSYKLEQGSCPTANVIGTCTRRLDKELLYQGFDPEELALRAKACTNHGGTWSK